MDFKLSRRCSMCGLNWPFAAKYETCPQCGEATSRVSNATPMDAVEAQALAAQAAFERYYEEYDATADPDRLTPGEAEAHFG